ncbi:MAG: cell division protein SepF, partial [Halobacteria archaeon]|nr:cell division protein SepF [Halobacteria archaeon]
ELASMKENIHNPERVIDDLRDLAHRIGGDIVQKGDEQLIITPRGVEIHREKVVG